MPERKDSPPTPLGIYDRPGNERITVIELTALILSALWLLLALSALASERWVLIQPATRLW